MARSFQLAGPQEWCMICNEILFQFGNHFCYCVWACWWQFPLSTVEMYVAAFTVAVWLGTQCWSISDLEFWKFSRAWVLPNRVILVQSPAVPHIITGIEENSNLVYKISADVWRLTSNTVSESEGYSHNLTQLCRYFSSMSDCKVRGETCWMFQLVSSIRMSKFSNLLLRKDLGRPPSWVLLQSTKVPPKALGANTNFWQVL